MTHGGSGVRRSLDREGRSKGHWAVEDFSPSLRAALIAGLWLLPAAAQLSGQTVQGHITDARTRFAVNGATVSLRDSTGSVVGRTATNYMGTFRITAPGPGVYSLLAEAMGYGDTSSDSFELEDGTEATVDLHLRPEPVELDTLAVETRRQRIVKKLETQGFYDRQRMGIGTFLTPDQIKQWPAISVGDILRHAPFVEVRSLGVQGSVIKVRGCAPTIYVDGNRIHDVPGNTPENWVRPEDIVAVEVYRGLAQIPLQWGMNETCGVILIWTSLGRDAGP